MGTHPPMITRRILAAAALLPATARAQPSWPSRPVRIIVPDAPGAGNDVTARVFAAGFERLLGQPFPVENRAGAGGRIGVEAAFRASPDGTTLLLGNAGATGINAALYRDLPYDVTRDFVPISLLVAGPNALCVNPRTFDVRDVPGLIAAIRARPPGTFNYATAGAGSSAHFSMELLLSMTGLDVVHVPFRGAAGMAQAVIQGDAGLLIANMVNVLPFARRGEMRMLAVTSLDRWPDTPDVPTLHESGLPGYETLAWNALFGPPGLPQPIVDRTRDAALRIGAEPATVDAVRALGGRFVGSTPAQLAERVRSDVAKWRDLAQRANIRIE